MFYLTLSFFRWMSSVPTALIMLVGQEGVTDAPSLLWRAGLLPAMVKQVERLVMMMKAHPVPSVLDLDVVQVGHHAWRTRA